MNTCYIQVDLKLPDMKTKVFFLICLFAGIGFTQIMAQSQPFRVSLTSEDVYLENPVYCDVNGEEVDRLALDYFDAHGVQHYKDGEFVFQWGKMSGQAHSLKTNEIFVYKEMDKALASETTYRATFNLIGNNWHHYIQVLVIENEYIDYILHPEVIKAICIVKASGK
jgi:hypothetical protein